MPDPNTYQFPDNATTLEVGLDGTTGLFEPPLGGDGKNYPNGGAIKYSGDPPQSVTMDIYDVGDTHILSVKVQVNGQDQTVTIVGPKHWRCTLDLATVQGLPGDNGVPISFDFTDNAAVARMVDPRIIVNPPAGPGEW